LSSNVSSGWSRIAFVVCAIVLSGALAGCQVRPLYSKESGTTEKLASVQYAPVTGRIAQALRNELIFKSAGGAGEPVKPEYEVKLVVSSSSTSTEVNDNDLYLNLPDNTFEGHYPGRVDVSAQYVLVRISDQKVIRSATRTVTSMVDLPQQQFANMRAIRDAQDRAVREVAEVLRTDIASALSR
jgi:LPS-assembly lipoprotein